MREIARRPAPAEIAAIVLLLALAAWLRLRMPEILPFNRDAGLLVSLADRFRSGEAILLGIPSSRGLVNPPLSVYLVALFELVTQSPRGLIAIQSCLQVAAIGWTWFELRRRFSPAVALAACAFYATSAWAVLYARILWPPCLAPLLSAAMLSSLWAWAADRRSWGLSAALMLSAAAVQLHLTGAAWFAVVAGVAVLARPPIDRRALLAGLAGAFLLLLPFAAGVAMQGAGAGTKRRALFVDFIGSPVRFFLLSGTHGGIDYHFPTVDSAVAATGTPASLVFTAVPWIAAALALAGAWIMAPRLAIARPWPFVRTGADPRLLVPFLFAAVPVAAMTFFGLDTSAHYLILEFPVVFLCMALALERLVSRGTRARVLAAALAALICATGIGVTRFLDGWIARDRPLWNWSAGYSATLGDQEAAVGWIAGDAGHGPIDLIATPDGSSRPPWDFFLLLDHARGTLTRPADRVDPHARRYLLVDSSNGGLSSQTRARLSERGARQFGAIWVCRWDG